MKAVIAAFLLATVAYVSAQFQQQLATQFVMFRGPFDFTAINKTNSFYYLGSGNWTYILSKANRNGSFTLQFNGPPPAAVQVQGTLKINKVLEEDSDFGGSASLQLYGINSTGELIFRGDETGVVGNVIFKENRFEFYANGTLNKL